MCINCLRSERLKWYCISSIVLHMTIVTKLKTNNSGYYITVLIVSTWMYFVQLFSLTMPFSQKLKRYLRRSGKLLTAELFPKGNVYIKKVLLSKVTQISSLTQAVVHCVILWCVSERQVHRGKYRWQPASLTELLSHSIQNKAGRWFYFTRILTRRFYFISWFSQTHLEKCLFSS